MYFKRQHVKIKLKQFKVLTLEKPMMQVLIRQLVVNISLTNCGRGGAAENVRGEMGVGEERAIESQTDRKR